MIGTMRVQPGQVWQSPDTGNRYYAHSISPGDLSFRVLALDGGRFGDAAYHWNDFPSSWRLVSERPDFEDVAQGCDVWNFNDKQTQVDMITQYLEEAYSMAFERGLGARDDQEGESA
jgi:hypothetical protein